MRPFIVLLLLLTSACGGLSKAARSEVQEHIRIQVEAALVKERTQIQKERAQALDAAYFENLVHLFLFVEAAKAGFVITSVDLQASDCAVSKICYKGTATFQRGSTITTLPVKLSYNGKFWDIDIDYTDLLVKMRRQKLKEAGPRSVSPLDIL